MARVLTVRDAEGAARVSSSKPSVIEEFQEMTHIQDDRRSIHLFEEVTS
jgi:hypothetical protein